MRRLIALFLMIALPCFGAYNYLPSAEDGEFVLLSGNYYVWTAKGTPTPTSDLILQYFGTGSDASTAIDKTANGYDGTVTGASILAVTNGLFDADNLAYSMSGSSQYIDAGTQVRSGFADPTNVPRLYVSMWVRADTFSGNDGLFAFTPFANGHGSFDAHFLSGNLHFQLLAPFTSHQRTVVGVPSNLGAWNHYVFVWDAPNGTASQGIYIYENGVLLAANGVNTADYGIIATNHKLIVGGYYGSAYTLDGDIWGVEMGTNVTAYISNLPATNRSQAVTLGILSDYVNENLADGLVFDWEANSLLDDGSTNSATMSTASAPTQLGDSTNGWYSFNGSANLISGGDYDYFTFSDGAGNDKPFTISAWINPNSLGVYNTIVGKFDASSSSEYLFLLDSGKLAITLYNAVGYANQIGRKYNSSTIATGTWSHVVATYDGTESAGGIDIYLNGVEVDDTDVIGGTYTGMGNQVTPLGIGSARGSTATLLFNGLLDQTLIWNTALTSNQVFNLYNAGRGN